MTLDQLLVLDTVARLGSFSAAARELNRVQSAISYSIKTLEEEMGLALFDRGSYRPELTEAGRQIQERARILLEEAEHLTLLGQQLAGGNEAVVRFDLSPTCPLEEVIPALKMVAETCPRTQLLISMEILGGESLVLEDKVDLSLTDMVAVDDQLETLLWGKIPMLPVAAVGHPLLEGEPSRTELSRQTQIVIHSTAIAMEVVSQGVQQGAPTWRVRDFETKRQLLLAGLGWGNMPDYLIRDELASGRLKQIQTKVLAANAANLYLVRKRHKAHGPVASELWDRLQGCREVLDSHQTEAGRATHHADDRRQGGG